MSDPVFYVGSMDKNHLLTGYVPSKFLMRNGAYVMDPTPGGSQRAYLYPDGVGNNKADGRVANPKQLFDRSCELHRQEGKEFCCPGC